MKTHPEEEDTTGVRDQLVAIPKTATPGLNRQSAVGTGRQWFGGISAPFSYLSEIPESG